MITLALLFALTHSQWATGNFPRNLYGPEDTRPECWGHAEADSLSIRFNPPPGYRAYIIRVRGDLVSWPKVLPNQPLPAKNTYAGVLVGFSTTSPEGSKECNWCADNTLAYIQDGLTGGEVRRTPFDWQIGRYLESDHTLVLKIASWLNTTGYPIHIEATWQAEYEYRRLDHD